MLLQQHQFAVQPGLDSATILIVNAEALGLPSIWSMNGPKRPTVERVPVAEACWLLQLQAAIGGAYLRGLGQAYGRLAKWQCIAALTLKRCSAAQEAASDSPQHRPRHQACGTQLSPEEQPRPATTRHTILGSVANSTVCTQGTCDARKVRRHMGCNVKATRDVKRIFVGALLSGGVRRRPESAVVVSLPRVKRRHRRKSAYRRQARHR
jgi:hypothetical protein